MKLLLTLGLTAVSALTAEPMQVPRWLQGTQRAYFFENHGDEGPPSNWWVHGEFAGLSLGSWYNIEGQVACIKEGVMSLTSELFAESDDHDAACKNEYGDDATVADWEYDIAGLLNEEEGKQIVAELDIPVTFNEKFYFVTYNGNKYLSDGYSEPAEPQCNASTPCPADQYCQFWDESGAGAYCSSCYSLDIPNVNSCPSSIPFQVIQDCIDTCIDPEFLCSSDAPCPNGQFCGFQLGESGYCIPCHNDDAYYMNYFKEPSDCDLWMDTPEGRAECKAQCFDKCSEETPCADGSFCAFEDESLGYCTNCTSLNGAPSRCSFRYFGNVSDAGMQECLSKCFDPCQFDGNAGERCPSGTYCTNADKEDSNNGSCASCDSSAFWLDDPRVCELENPDAPIVVEECATSCFGVCTADEPCDDGSFCSLEDDNSGYCMECENLSRLERCFDRDAPDGGKLCASTCFGECSADKPCNSPESPSFCNYDNGQGYCDSCDQFWTASQCQKLESADSQASCVSMCFDECSSNATCPVTEYYDLQFCDYQLGSSGACLSCGNYYNGPNQCFEEGDDFDPGLSEAGARNCNATCFQPCDTTFVYQQSDCPDGMLCYDNGYCGLDYNPSDKSSAGSTHNLFLLGTISFVAVIYLM